MTHPTSAGRERLVSRRALLALSTALAGTLGAPALAQTATQQAIYRNIDANGVDLTNGSFNIAIREGSIGAGVGAIELWRYGGSRVGTDNLTVKFTRSVASGVATFDLVFGNRRETFSGPASATTFSSGQGNGATLTKIDAANYRYTASDGTVTLYAPPPGLTNAGNNGFCSPGQETACGLIATSTTEPNGVITTYEWDVGENCRQTGVDRFGEPIYTCAQFWRQRAQSNNLGYRAAFTFQQEANPTTGLPGTAWHTRSGASLTNTRVSGPARTVSYAYPSSNVVQITDDSGKVWRITSDSNYGITAVKRPGANTDSTTVAYGANGVTSVTRDGVTTSYNRTISGATGTMTVTNALNQQTVVTSDLAKGRPTSVKLATNDTTTYAYDAQGRLTGVVQPEGDSLTYGFDARGNVTSTLQVTKPTASTQQALTTSFVYPGTCTNPVTCNLPTSSTDARNNTTDYAYDPVHGGVTSVTRPAAPNGVQPQTRYGYSAIGSSGVTLLTSVSECQTLASCAGASDERKTTIAYNDPNLLPTSVSTGSGDGALTAASTYTYDYIGNLLSVDGPLAGAGDTTTMRYDAARRMVGVISADPDGSGPLARQASRITYNADDQVTQAENGTVTGTDDASWNAFSSAQQAIAQYDANGRKVQDSVTAGGTTYSLTQYGFDALGRSICTAVRMNTSVFGSPSSNACVPGPQGADGPDRVTQVGYDAAGRIGAATTAFGTPDASTETISYTANGKPEYLTDANGNRTRLIYDGFDRLFQKNYPDKVTPGGVSGNDYEAYLYDATGNVTLHRLRDGNTITYGYDALGRRSHKSPGGVRGVAYDYDMLGQMKGAYYDGVGSSDAVTMTYDALGRVTASTTSMAGTSRTLGYQYDVAGNRTRITHPDGVYFDTSYDALGRAAGASWWAPGVGTVPFMGIAHDDLGRRTRIARGSSVTNYSYDAPGRLVSTGQGFAYGVGDGTQGYGYNPAGQVKLQTLDNDAYAWTGHGNTDRSYAANGLNQVTAAGSSTLTYDANGNLISDGTTSYTYDPENRLVGASASGGTTLTYDPLGRLWQTTSPVWGKTQFVYDGDQIAIEYDGDTGGMRRRYMFSPYGDEPILWDEGSAMNCSGTKFLHTDRQGSVVALAGCVGNRTAVNAYDEYGRPQSSNQGRFGYTGQAWLPELGLWYYKARMYAPNLGRFMQTDPIGHDAGMNLYGYVAGDPVNLTDPTGMLAKRLPPSPKTLPQADGGGGVQGPEVIVAGQYQPQSQLTGNLAAAANSVRGGMALPRQPGQDNSPQKGCSARGAAMRARLDAAASNLGPVTYDSANEVGLLAQYFRGDTTPYRLSGAEMAQARAYVGTYGNNVLGSQVRAGAGGTTERSVFFGKFATDAPLLDGLLGTATGIFRGGSLVGIRDTFNFDFKDRGGYPYGTFANVGVAMIRADAAGCAGNISIPVTGG